MTDEMLDVLVAAYEELDAARRDFDGLCGLVENKTITTEGAILVAKDEDGQVTLVDTGDHVGRKGAGWGGGVGAVSRSASASSSSR